MKALILAAGYATRLYPLNQKLPKALLPVGQETVLGHIVSLVNAVPDCREILIVTNHRFVDDFRRWKAGYAGQIPVTLLDDGSMDVAGSFGAIGDICFAIQQREIDDDLLIIAGDTWFDFSLEGFLASCRQSGQDGVCVKKIDDRRLLTQMGVVLLDGNDTIIQIEEKPSEPKSDLAMFAIYYYTRQTVGLFDRYKREGQPMDAPGNFLVWLYPQKAINTYAIEGQCHDVGTVDAYARLCDSLGIAFDRDNLSGIS